MRKLISLYFFLFSVPFTFAYDGYLRNRNADVIHYQFELTLNDSTSRIEGRASVKVKLFNNVTSFSLDLKSIDKNGKGMVVERVILDYKDVKWEHRESIVTINIDRSISVGDIAEFVVEYSGIPADGLIISKNKFGNRTFFADHWPDRAHNYLPCIDHPYDKAAVDFIIIAPDRYKVVASGNLVEESHLLTNATLTHWSETVPLPTKVMAFGAAQFAVQLAGEVNGIPVWSWVYPENRKEGFSDYSVAVKPLEYYSRIIGQYPYEKLANVQSKTIYGGLENAGTIFYSENSVTGEGKAEGLIVHEIAHQWFGDCVTEADWHHVWLSEGFATYLTSLYFESFKGRARLEADMATARSRVFKFYEKQQLSVIDTTITNLMELLNANSYQKGAWVLHMLRQEIGTDNFMKGLQLYYKQFYNTNALTEDFIKIMEDASGRNLDWFFHQWLYLPGQPELKITQKSGTKRGTVDVLIEQTQANLFEFTLELLIKDKSNERIEKIVIKNRITELTLKVSDKTEIIPDPNVNLLYKLL